MNFFPLSYLPDSSPSSRPYLPPHPEREAQRSYCGKLIELTPPLLAKLQRKLSPLDDLQKPPEEMLLIISDIFNLIDDSFKIPSSIPLGGHVRSSEQLNDLTKTIGRLFKSVYSLPEARNALEFIDVLTEGYQINPNVVPLHDPIMGPFGTIRIPFHGELSPFAMAVELNKPQIVAYFLHKEIQEKASRIDHNRNYRFTSSPLISRTCLSLACSLQYWEVIDALLDSPTLDPHQSILLNCNQRTLVTPLELATIVGKDHLVDKLLKHPKMDWNREMDPLLGNPFQKALECNHILLYDKLIDHFKKNLHTFEPSDLLLFSSNVLGSYSHQPPLQFLFGDFV